MGALGYLFGSQIENVLGPIGLGALAVVIVVSFLAWRFFKRQQDRLMVEAERALPGALAAPGGRSA